MTEARILMPCERYKLFEKPRDCLHFCLISSCSHWVRSFTGMKWNSSNMLMILRCIFLPLNVQRILQPPTPVLEIVCTWIGKKFFDSVIARLSDCEVEALSSLSLQIFHFCSGVGYTPLLRAGTQFEGLSEFTASAWEINGSCIQKSLDIQ